jgi:hypothetical protein
LIAMNSASTILVSSVALLAACGAAVRPADGDAQLDVTNRDDALDARALLDEAGFDAALDVREDVQTNGDVFFERFDDTPDSVDAGVPRDVPIDIPPAEASCAEPGARPLRSLRS